MQFLIIVFNISFYSCTNLAIEFCYLVTVVWPIIAFSQLLISLCSYDFLRISCQSSIALLEELILAWFYLTKQSIIVFRSSSWVLLRVKYILSRLDSLSFANFSSFWLRSSAPQILLSFSICIFHCLLVLFFYSIYFSFCFFMFLSSSIFFYKGFFSFSWSFFNFFSLFSSAQISFSFFSFWFFIFSILLVNY